MECSEDAFEEQTLADGDIDFVIALLLTDIQTTSLVTETRKSTIAPAQVRNGIECVMT